MTYDQAIFHDNRMRHWNRGLVFILSFLLYLLPSGCDIEQQGSDVPLQEPLSLRLGVPAQPTAALFIIALEKGFFSQAGLDVKPLRFPSGKRSLVEGFIPNRIDASSPSGAPVVITAFDRDDFVILCSLFKTDNTNRIVARRDHGIDKPTDLKGKRIGTQQGSAVHYFLHLFLTSHGLSEKDVDIVFMKAEQLPVALARGDIDAFSMREPYVSLALSMLPNQAHAMAKPGLHEQMDLLVMRRSLLEEQPEIALRMLRGLKAAEEFIADNPADAVVTTARYLGSPNEKIRAIWPTLQLRVSLDESMIDLLEKQAQWVKASGIAKDKDIPDFRKFIKPEPLQLLWPERVTYR
jgi:ABC-type nitrate/sulfonate/bicarbonate transport system substrate-binding protein